MRQNSPKWSLARLPVEGNKRTKACQAIQSSPVRMHTHKSRSQAHSPVRREANGWSDPLF
jgi:hypothetical protein